METPEPVVLLAHPTFLVSCAAGREAEARRELRRAIGGGDARSLFMRGNLLLGTPGRDPGSVLEALRAAETRTLGRIVPVTVKALIGPGAEHLDTLGQAALAAVSLEPGSTFRVECRRRGRHAFGSRDVQRAVGMRIEAETSAVFAFEGPERLVLVEIFQDWVWIGSCAPADVLHKTLTRMRVYAPGRRPLNRAEKKLREALAAFGLTVEPGLRALDLGAAPGGWTKVLAEAGAEVLAVDPADLASDVATLPNVQHFRGRSEELLAQPGLGPFDLLTNDMNLDPTDSAEAVRSLLPLLSPSARVMMTVKFMTPRRREHIQEVLAVLGSLFAEHREQRLPHNAKETTLCFSRPFL